MPKIHYLFAYGTLLIGTPEQTFNQLLRKSLRIDTRACIQARLYELGSYPGAVPSPSPQDRVYGYLLVLRQPDRILPLLDAYEGHDPCRLHESEFVRVKTRITPIAHRAPQPVWVYYYNRPLGRAPRIRSGDYLACCRRGPGSELWPELST